MTGSGDTVLEHRASDAGALRILKKPLDPTSLLEAVRRRSAGPL